MKLYLAIETYCTPDGNHETVHGVFSTPEQAIQAMSSDTWLATSKPTQRKWCTINIVDGELAIEYEAVEVELDKARF